MLWRLTPRQINQTGRSSSNDDMEVDDDLGVGKQELALEKKTVKLKRPNAGKVSESELH